MAKASWCTVNPASGFGEVITAISSDSPHTGRSPRTTTVTYSARGVASARVVTVAQKAAEEFVTLNDPNRSLMADGETLVVTGTSNASKLTFALGSGDLNLALPANYTIGGKTTVDNGAVISGDPGAARAYEFSLSLVVPVNTDAKEKTKVLSVATDGRKTSTVTLVQGPALAYITVSPTEVSLEAAGSTQRVTVTANADWTAS